jgi:hypothetical protein
VPKSYKICLVQHFDGSRFGDQPYSVSPQYSLSDVPEAPSTVIYKALDTVRFEDFDSYMIEHEHEVSMVGRVNAVKFAKFIRKGFIHGYESKAQKLLLLSGKKDDILDFCRTTASLPEIKIATLQIDMKALLSKLKQVKLVWFKFASGMIRASALMGDHVEATADFERAKSQGEISTLSFYVEDSEKVIHPILVTADGTVVLQDFYQSVALEIQTVLEVKSLLLDGIYKVEQIRANRKH